MRLIAIVWLSVLASCGGPRRGTRLPEDVQDPALLVATGEITPHFVVQQRVRASFGSREFVFQAIIQNSENGLAVVALTPQGQKALVLEQRGKVVTYEIFLRENLPFSPWRILLDIHRTYFRGSREPLPDGTHVVDDASELVRETWRGGSLRTRTYEKKSARASGLITIRYGGESRELFERSATYHDGYVGYTLEVTPVRFSRLPTPVDEAAASPSDSPEDE